MDVEADFDRPPAPIGPRWPSWAVLAIVWAVSIPLSILFYNLEAQPSTPGVQLLLFVVDVVALTMVSIAFVVLRSGRSRVFVNRWWSGQGYPQGDPDEAPRLADRQERRASKRLRLESITRAQYERIIAYRHFVHGEISRSEYLTRFARIGEEEERSWRTQSRDSQERRQV